MTFQVKKLHKMECLITFHKHLNCPLYPCLDDSSVVVLLAGFHVESCSPFNRC